MLQRLLWGLRIILLCAVPSLAAAETTATITWSPNTEPARGL
jgi:hypothetical protein